MEEDSFHSAAGDFRRANIQLVKADGSENRELTQGTISIGFPAWSPACKTIVYRARGKESGPDVRGLRALNLADNKVTLLTTTWDNFPSSRRAAIGSSSRARCRAPISRCSP